MAGNSNKKIYCFDSSAFIDSWRRYYPPDIFPSVWEEFERLINEGRIIVPKEVEKELLNGNDELKEWFKKHSQSVRKYTVEQLNLVKKVVADYPKASDYNKVKEFHADPFVVSLAKIEDLIVVTFEGNNGDTNNPRIPFLCKKYDVECCNMIKFFQNEGLSFRHSSE